MVQRLAARSKNLQGAGRGPGRISHPRMHRSIPQGHSRPDQLASCICTFFIALLLRYSWPICTTYSLTTRHLHAHPFFPFLSTLSLLCRYTYVTCYPRSLYIAQTANRPVETSAIIWKQQMWAGGAGCKRPTVLNGEHRYKPRNQYCQRTSPPCVACPPKLSWKAQDRYFYPPCLPGTRGPRS